MALALDFFIQKNTKGDLSPFYQKKLYYVKKNTLNIIKSNFLNFNLYLQIINFNFRFGHVFLFDTGTSNGNLSGQSRPMSSIDFKPTRPYRLISASEDYTVALFEGPPFKFKTVCIFL